MNGETKRSKNHGRPPPTIGSPKRSPQEPTNRQDWPVFVPPTRPTAGNDRLRRRADFALSDLNSISRPKLGAARREHPIAQHSLLRAEPPPSRPLHIVAKPDSTSVQQRNSKGHSDVVGLPLGGPRKNRGHEPRLILVIFLTELSPATERQSQSGKHRPDERGGRFGDLLFPER